MSCEKLLLNIRGKVTDCIRDSCEFPTWVYLNYFHYFALVDKMQH